MTELLKTLGSVLLVIISSEKTPFHLFGESDKQSFTCMKTQPQINISKHSFKSDIALGIQVHYFTPFHKNHFTPLTLRKVIEGIFCMIL